MLRPGLGVYVACPTVRSRCPLRLSRNLFYRTPTFHLTMAKYQRRGAPRKFPDPGNSSPNSPTQTMSKADVLEFYNQETGNQAAHVADGVRTWTVDYAREVGFDSAEFHGAQNDVLVLGVDFGERFR